jgi:hypothetical protein
MCVSRQTARARDHISACYSPESSVMTSPVPLEGADNGVWYRRCLLATSRRQYREVPSLVSGRPGRVSHRSCPPCPPRVPFGRWCAAPLVRGRFIAPARTDANETGATDRR